MNFRIAFSGIDGAGKTTQIELLSEYLKSKGYKSKVLWSRGGYTPGILLFKRMLRIVKFKAIPEKSGNSRARTESFNRPIIRKSWLIISICDLILFYCVYARILHLYNHSLIFDRLHQDTLLDFQLNFPQHKVETWLLWRLVEKFSIRPQVHFIFLIPVKESIKRSLLKKEPFPDSASVLQKRHQFYTQLTQNESQFFLIDGEKNKKEIFREVTEKVIAVEN